MPDLLEDILAASASPHMDPTEANDAINLMEVFGVPRAERLALGVCESELALGDPKSQIEAESAEAILVAS
jgi:hypothetical protein